MTTFFRNSTVNGILPIQRDFGNLYGITRRNSTPTTWRTLGTPATFPIGTSTITTTAFIPRSRVSTFGSCSIRVSIIVDGGTTANSPVSAQLFGHIFKQNPSSTDYHVECP